MRMQEPEQWRQSGQQWQAGREYNAEYPGNYESGQQEYSEARAQDDYQQQKLHPQEEQSQRNKRLAIIAIVLSALGFFLSLAGIITSAIALKYASGQQTSLTGDVIGLVVSILVLLISVAVYVIALVALVRRSQRWRRWMRARAQAGAGGSLRSHALRRR
jgi:ABC-type Fe3+ transport system permease subunit